MSVLRSAEPFRASRSSKARTALTLRPFLPRMAVSRALSKAKPSACAFMSFCSWVTFACSPATSTPSKAFRPSCAVLSWAFALSSWVCRAVAADFSRLMSAPFSCMIQLSCSSVMPGILFFTSSRFMVETPFVCETSVFYTVLCQYSVLGGVRAARRMAPFAGLEPAASGFGDRRSSDMS